MSSDDKPEIERTTIMSRKKDASNAAVREDMAHYLVIIEGSDPGRRIELGPTPLTMGRDPNGEVVFADTEVSRRHLRAAVWDDKVVVEDLASTNGTLVDGKAITQPTTLPDGSIVQAGGQTLQHERRSRRDVARSQELDNDLAKASSYVSSLLPKPLDDGPVRSEWFFLPSTQLGGDAFGYDFLDDDTFAVYILDVSGHGVGAAMLSVSVLNVLRQRALPRTDFKDPTQVLTGLNAMFQTDRHDGMYFTIWYGVYDVKTRILRHGCAGHHAGYLVPTGRSEAIPLREPGLIIGALVNTPFKSDQVPVPAGSSLYLFSDGVFEIVTKEGRQWRLGDLRPMLLEPEIPNAPESQRLYRAVRDASRPGPFDDDFSILVLTFV